MKRGGWQPVIKRRPVGYQLARFRGLGMFIIFVDNLPESMDPRGLFKLFSSYGVVKDVFILKKRMKVIGTRFGFVRYDCQVTASMAVQKAEGLWCDDKELKVQIAEYRNKDQNLKIQESRKESTIEGRKEEAKETEDGNDVSINNEVASKVKDTVDGGTVKLDKRGKRVAVSSLRQSNGGLGNSTGRGFVSVGMMKIVESPRKKGGWEYAKD
ncbi:uncharacterized protein LOC114300665 [Camellia sinensis]|uniref:uncharacterized protein LOC114300665 n=1 Tax=Camellia sinensis TaxID=4442 RepID=UPI00103678E3|nr:uncharacterized protein LOC114300665 [Camellia sinensis]